MKNREPYQFDENRDDQVRSFPEIELPFTKNKDDVWAQLSSAIDSEATPEEVTKAHNVRLLYLKPLAFAAAIVAVMLMLVLFAGLYSKSISTGAGEHLVCVLPDNSSVELNAASTLSYKPLWWWFNREVKFEGEGFFKVQKGEQFDVVSYKGTTSVLGTSFNIYARQDDYTVTCLTGRVKVANIESGLSTEITPNQQAEVLKDGSVISHQLSNTSDVISWKDNMFTFTAMPISKVFEEIERQYGVSIITKEQLKFNYTGNFTKNQAADSIMHNICLALGLHYEMKDGSYVVSK